MKKTYKNLAKMLNAKLKDGKKLNETEWRVLECAVTEEIDEEADFWFLPVAQDMLYDASSERAHELVRKNPKIPAWRHDKDSEMVEFFAALNDVQTEMERKNNERKQNQHR